MVAISLTARLPQPDPWLAHAIDPYRACTRCSHGRTGADGERRCTHPEVKPHGAAGSGIEAARSASGLCGPDARLAAGLW